MALLVTAALLVAELGAIGVIFKHAIAFECLANWPARACSGASGALVALYCLLGALALFGMLRPQPLRDLVRQAGERLWPLALNAAGVVLALVPVAFLREGSGTAALIPSFGFWFAGMVFLLAGLLLYLAPLPRWRVFLAGNLTTLVPVLVAGALAPSLSILIRPLWRIETIADTTFTIVAWAIGAIGYEVFSDPAAKVIGTEEFSISVAPVCSGIEGIALVTVFVTLYLVLFRREMRFPRALLLYPIGIAASALFNVIRITLLLMIGLEGNPALAVGGFHSHAGWLMFTLVALGIIALAQTVPVLKTAPDAGAIDPVLAENDLAPLPFWRDPVVARILPFAVFMLSALAVSTLSQMPGMLYPARVLVLGAVVLVFLPIYARLSWALDPIAIAAGAAIGAMWILIPVPEAEGGAPYGTLAGGVLALWFVARGVGTIVLVPLVEELFFRDYLESRLRLDRGTVWAIFAALITATLFAALHDRWAEAFVAGLVFSAVARRRQRIADAILSHAVANAIVFAAAAIGGNLHII
ncbi:exosortase E/protease, VPEID-CTERM system [Rhodovulum marinum]|nr:exosortase E/protease, VPEID-CTERM system [Rhodovulum marinum]